MRYYDGVKIATSSLVIIGLLASAVSLLAYNSSAHGLQDNIQVMVCPAANQSYLTVLRPQSDSVVSEPKLPISGSVEYISQIDFFIDDVYNNTVALGFSATDFETSLTLNPGTHTIKLIATDSCSQTTHEYSLVVTYEPKTPPSIGQDVETIIDGRVRQGGGLPIVPEPEKSIIDKAIDRFVIPQYEAIKDALDIGGSTTTDPAVKAGNVARTVLFATGGLLALSAVHIGALSASVLPDRLASLLPFRRRAMAAIALSGVVLMMLVFIV